MFNFKTIKANRLKTLLILVFSLVMVLSLVLFITNFKEDNELISIKNEALSLLVEKDGEYDKSTIVLHNTSKQEAKQIADKLGAKLRISKDGKFATLTLLNGKTINDVYNDDSNIEYLKKFSLDFYAQITDIDEVEVRQTTRPQYEISGEGYYQQTYLDYLNIDKTWLTTKGRGITVAVIDTGIDTDHPEFKGRISEYSYNASEDKIVKDYILKNGEYDWSLVEDEQGHGTAVTGVIAAPINGDGIVGVAPEVNIIVIKVECDKDGIFARTSDLVFGLYYAIERDVDIVNMSFCTHENLFADATLLAVDSDIICVASAGNYSNSELCYPASDDNVIGVGALKNNSWELADYSNFGENVNIVAPGTTYTTLMGGEYGVKSGTSFACPIAVGAISLYLSINLYSTFEKVKEVLYASTYDLGDLGEDWYYGYGAVDIYSLVEEQKGTVTFNMLTEELENTNQVFVRNHTLQDIPFPERTYLVFDGWYYDIDCTEELNLYSDVFSSDLTLYASWANEDDGVPYTYIELDDGTIEIKSYIGKRKYITIPDYIDGKEVSSIGWGAFMGNTRLCQVNLPGHLKVIKDSAFEKCSNLVSIMIPQEVISIGINAFKNNIRLSSVGFTGNSQLQNIGSFAFEGCSKLQQFDIPKSVVSVDGSAFFGDTSLMTFTVDSRNEKFKAVNNVLFNKNLSTLVCYPAGRIGEYTIPNGTEKISSYAFGYAKITTIDLDGIISLGESSFKLSKLRSVVISDSVTSIERSSFSDNYYLNSVIIGNGLNEIEDRTFENCESLTSIIIPKNIEKIKNSAFIKTGLKTIIFEKDSMLKTIGQGAFSYTYLKALNLPDSLVIIEDNAFSCCYFLKKITFGSGLNSIGASAFSNTKSLRQVIFNDELKTIGRLAFIASGLTECVTLPSSLQYLGEGAFASCHDLENIYVEEGNEYYVDVDGVVYNQSLTTLIEYPAGNKRTTYSINNTTVEIGNFAFYGSCNLVSMMLPNSIISIGEYGFYDCEEVHYYHLSDQLMYIKAYAFSNNISLESITIPSTVYQISNYAFSNNYEMRKATFMENATITRLSYGAFEKTGITSFTVPASVSTISQDVFKDCPYLTTITFAKNSKLESISAYMFVGCDNVTNITFLSGSKLTSIQAHGLEGMTKLQTIDFGNAKLTNIDNYAFRYCENLKTLEVPEGVTYIGRYAFYGCKDLKRLDLPLTIEYIGENAFYFDENLDIYFKADTLPKYLSENWDNGIRRYYVGVNSIEETTDWTYAVLNSGKIAILKYKGNETNVDLTTLTFGEITSIGDYAFSSSLVENIVLPETLTIIQQYAFAMAAIKTINLPNTVTFIGKYAFTGSKLTSISFGDNIQNIEQYAFASCKDLKTEIVIPASLTQLGRYAFYQSGITGVNFSHSVIAELPEGVFMGTKLTTVTLPDHLTLINNNAFRDCEELQTVTFGSGDLQIMSNVFYNTGLIGVYIPDNVTYIGEYSFVGLNNLKEFTVSLTHSKYKTIDGLLYSKDGRKLICAPAGKTGEITLPQSLEVLGFGAFENSRLTKIDFNPNSNILTFGYRCFYNSFIKEINIPKSIVSFDFYAFAMCKNLTTITFEEGSKLNGIYEGAFYGCINLKNIVIPDSIVEIFDFAFYGCRRLEGFPISNTSNIIDIYDYAFAYTTFDEIVLPDSLQDIKAYAFMGSSMKKVVISNTNKDKLTLGIGIFLDCENLEEITLPFIGASFEDVRFSWFGYIFGAGGYEANNTYIPSSLKTVTITDGIEYIMPCSFYGIDKIERVNLPNSVKNIGIGAFYDTTFCYEFINEISTFSVDNYGNKLNTGSINYNYVGKGFTGSLILSNSITSIDYLGFKNCSCLTSITIPNSVTSIGDDAFYDCTGLTSVIIGKNVTRIGKNLFRNCSSLTSIVLPDGITSIGDYAFYNCTSLTNIVLPEGITSIGEWAFTNCSSLTSINIPNNVTSIGDNAFYYCSSLTSINIPNGKTSIEPFAFCGCTSLTNIVLPEGITSIGECAFTNCSSLTSINIPNNVTSIGNSAFSNCNSLTSISIPNKVTSISSSTFLNCSSLTSIFLPDSVITINDHAFSNCSSLTSIVLPDSVTTIGAYAFYYCIGLTSITIPGNVKSIGKEAFNGCESLYNIQNNISLQLEIGSSDNGYVAYYAKMINSSDGSRQYINDGYHYTETKNQFLFQQRSGTFQLIAYLGDDETVTLPTDIFGNEYTIYQIKGVRNVIIPDGVTSIGSQAFNNCSSLTSISIPNSVTSIGSQAFNNCSSLTSISIPNSVTSIGNNAFSDCCRLTSIILPDSVTNIGGAAFLNCSNLTSISIPNSVTSIGIHTFNNCSNLMSVTVGNKVTSIGEFAFGNCSSLTKIVLPDSVTSIGNSAFYNCSNLMSITVGNNLTKIGESAFGDCSSLTKIVLSDGVTSIGSSAFEKCSSLTNITIGNGLTSISPNVFNGCSSLTSIVLPDSVTSIGKSAFAYCSNLSSIIIGNGLTSIDDYAFEGCSNLIEIKISKENNNFTFESGLILNKDKTNIVLILPGAKEIVIPDSVTSIGRIFRDNTLIEKVSIGKGLVSIDNSAFLNCSSLTSIVMPDCLTSIGNTAFSNCSSLTSVNIPNSVTSIGYGAFSNCSSLTSVNIPNSIANIDSSVFSKCSSLTSINIPNSVTSIGNSAFSNCSNLTSIVMPDGLTSIGNNVFSDCSSLTSINIPKSVTSIGKSAFFNCSSLNDIYITDIEAWLKIHFYSIYSNPMNDNSSSKNMYLNGELLTDLIISNKLESIGDYTFSNCSSLKTIVFPDGVTSIGNSAFSNCSNLTSINIPNSVTSIGDSAFSNCSNLMSVTMGNNVTSIGDFAFRNCSSLTSIVLPDSVTSIGKSAFYNCNNLTSIVMPDGLTSIGNAAFSNCSKLTSIVLPDGLTSIGDSAFLDCSSLTSITIPNRITSIGNKTFNNCSNLTSIVLPDVLKGIGDSAFLDCSGLISITIPNSVTSIGNNAFSNCNNLTSIVMPDGLTSIGNSAFSNCSKLTSIVMPDGLTKIGSSAFSDCSGLTSITIPNRITSIGNKTFNNCNNLTSVVLPDGLRGIGSSAFSNCSRLTSIALSNNIKNIGDQAFSCCYNLYEIQNNSSLNLQFGSSRNGGVAYYAKLIITSDGSKLYNNDGYTYIETENHFLFEQKDDTYQLIDYIGNDETVTLPTDIYGNNYTIYEMKGVKNVIIPDGITNIGDYAFFNCSSLTSVVIGNSVTNIGDSAFYNCSSLTSVVISNSVTNIDDSAFYNCSSLTSVVIGDSVTNIGDSAFYNCSSLTSITIGDNVTSIGRNVFNGTSYYNNTSNWKNGALYIGNYLIKVKSEVYEVVCIGKASIDAFDDCKYTIKKVTLCGNQDKVLFNLTNLETLVLTEMPIDSVIRYFGYNNESIPVTLKSIVLKQGCEIKSSYAFYEITDVSIYVETEKINTRWDYDYKDWNNGNVVYYGGKWIEAVFQDDKGEIINHEYRSVSQIVRQPFVKDINEEKMIKSFIGWDVDKDGIVDNFPATSKVNIYATAIYEVHHLSDWIITLQSTCTSAGERQIVCLDCGKVYESEMIEALGHNYNKVVTEPTCTEQGYTTHTCSRCNDSYVDSYVNARHKVEHEADCTHDQVCMVCGTTLVEKLGHNYIEVVTEPTCTEQGYTTHTCSRCNDSYVDNYVNYKGHTAGEWIVVKEPKVGEEGLEEVFCKDCGEILDEKTIPALDIPKTKGCGSFQSSMNIATSLLLFACCIWFIKRKIR